MDVCDLFAVRFDGVLIRFLNDSFAIILDLVKT